MQQVEHYIDVAAFRCQDCDAETVELDGGLTHGDNPACSECGEQMRVDVPVRFEHSEEGEDAGSYPLWGLYRCVTRDEECPDDPCCDQPSKEEERGWYLPLPEGEREPACESCGQEMLRLETLKVVRYGDGAET